MYSRNFGSEKIVCTLVRLPLHVSRSEILHFKHPHVSAVNRMATRTFREEENSNNKADSFFRLDFNVYTDVDNKERARVSDKTNEKKKEKQDNFITAVRKWEIQEATKVKMSGSSTYEISSVKRVTIVITGDWLWKTTNIKYKKKRCCSLCWKLTDSAKIFCFLLANCDGIN